MLHLRDLHLYARGQQTMNFMVCEQCDAPKGFVPLLREHMDAELCQQLKKLDQATWWKD